MTPKLSSYDYIIVAFSGGKDSLACLLHLLDLTEDGSVAHRTTRSKIELWHHEVDGREGSTLMDWPVTADYCRQVARAFDIPIYYSWRIGGFELEMNRNNSPTAAIAFETPDGLRKAGGEGSSLTTRMKFPAIGAIESGRWCSALLKIDIAARVFTNDPRFEHKKTLIITGERAEESAIRSHYVEFEPHKSDLRKPARASTPPRHIDQWRPVHKWDEEQVWNIIGKYRVNPHPAYRLGWGRLSCAPCIFGDADQWASLKAVNPHQYSQIVAYEKYFGYPIRKKDQTIPQYIQIGVKVDPTDTRRDAERRPGTPYPETANKKLVKLALSTSFNEPVILPKGQWKLPAGAYRKGGGPT